MAIATAAKLLQSCPTLCDPIDGSPPGSPIPGILQARTLEWVAISFSNAWKWKVKEVAQSCPSLWDPMDCSPPGSSIHGVFQARVLEWVPSPSPIMAITCLYLVLWLLQVSTLWFHFISCVTFFVSSQDVCSSFFKILHILVWRTSCWVLSHALKFFKISLSPVFHKVDPVR